MTCELFVSKVIEENNVAAFGQYGIGPESFFTPLESSVVKFTIDYAKENGGNPPSYATIVTNFPDFIYVPEVTDSFEYLARNIKEKEGKQRIAELINKELPTLYDSSDSDTVISTLQERLQSIKMGTSVRCQKGINIRESATTFLEEYEKRRKGESFKIWRSKFPSINKAIGGGYTSSNVYAWFGRSGRGKSVVTQEDAAIEAAIQGANVLVWSLEMARYEWLARAYSSLSARQGLITAMIDGAKYDAGFENRALLTGNLSPEFEEGLRTFATTLPDTLAGNITLRAVDDADFSVRTIRELEADIRRTKADVVLIDPIYYMDFEANTSRTTGGDVAATSIALRRVAGATGAVIHVITQAEEDASEKTDGIRELKPPKRAEVMKSKAILQDAALLIGVDTLAQEGRGILELGKGRNGGEDTQVEIVFLPNYGIVREFETGQAAASQFMP
jgi:replicative DNA helicase